MTLNSISSRIAYAGNGSTQSFPVPFKIWAPSDLKIYRREAASQTDIAQALTTDFTLDIAAYPGTGNVVFTVAPPAGATIVILRDMALTQELDLQASGAFAAENMEVQLDKLTAEIQTLRELLARTPRLPVGSPLSELALPEPRPSNANQLLGITSTGDAYELKAAVSLPLQTVSSFVATLLDDPDAATARATLGIGSAIDLSLLTTDATGGAHADFVAFVDTSEAGASNKVPVPNFFSVAIAGATDTTPADQTTYEVMARKTSDGTLHRMALAEFGIGKHTIWLPASAMLARTTGGAASGTLELATNKVMLRTLDFDATLVEYAQVSVQMPKGWNEGTLSAIFVWSHAAAVSNFNVVWAIRGVAVSDDDALDASFGSTAQITDTGGTASDLYRSPETGPLTLAGTPSETDVAILEIFRLATDAADTLAIDARLHGVALFYATNANTDT